jgi:MoaA/NifB/PqqE/SkfB family radical SAM enzyme
MFTVAKYVLTQKITGVKRYPLVLMLEPLFRCNLACAGRSSTLTMSWTGA